MDRLVAEVDNVYTQNTIDRALVIAGTDLEARDLAGFLNNSDHSVALITTDTCNCEREYEELELYKLGYSKVLVLSYDAWRELRDDLEQYVWRHNLLVFGDELDSQLRRGIYTWVRDMHKRGFKPLEGMSEYLILSNG